MRTCINRMRALGSLALVLAPMLALTACGSKAQREATTAQGGIGNGNVGTHTSTSTGTGTGTGTTTGFEPTRSYTVDLNVRTGTGTQTNILVTEQIIEDVPTDDVLKIKVIPGPAGTLNLPGKPYSASYQCASYQITVLGRTVTTQVLSLNGYCLDTAGYYNPYYVQAPKEQVITFSESLTPGHGPIDIKISNPRYSFKCEACLATFWANPTWWAGGCANYCKVAPVYDTHTMSATIEIETN